MSDDVKPYTREELAVLETSIDNGWLSDENRRIALTMRRLLATCRAALEDTERLDWLDSMDPTIQFSAHNISPHYGLIERGVDSWLPGTAGLRNAIDALCVISRSKRSGLRTSPEGK